MMQDSEARLIDTRMNKLRSSIGRASERKHVHIFIDHDGPILDLDNLINRAVIRVFGHSIRNPYAAFLDGHEEIIDNLDEGTHSKITENALAFLASSGISSTVKQTQLFISALAEEIINSSSYYEDALTFLLATSSCCEVYLTTALRAEDRIKKIEDRLNRKVFAGGFDEKMLKCSKRSPQYWEGALGETGADPKFSIVIEDCYSDGIAAKGLGIPLMLVDPLGRYHDKEDIDYSVRSLDAAIPIVLSLELRLQDTIESNRLVCRPISNRPLLPVTTEAH